MLLPDHAIAEWVGRYRLVSGYDSLAQLGPCSFDLRLGPADEALTLPDGRVVLPPRGFGLAVTCETVELPAHLAGRLVGRSRYARQGLFVNATADLIQPGFRGQIVLELFNAGPRSIELTPGERVCSLEFHLLESKARHPYAGQYQGQTSFRKEV